MKISGKFILKVAGTLTVIALIVAALLGAVNQVTAGPIAAINKANTDAALAKVVTDKDSTFEPQEITDDLMAAASAQGGTLAELYAIQAGGEQVGYAVKVVASGSQGSIEMIVGTDANKAITGISVVKHAETSGIGTKVCNDNAPATNGTPVLDQFVGLSGSGSLVVKGNIAPVSGATVSTTGVTKGANAALAVVEALA